METFFLLRAGEPLTALFAFFFALAILASSRATFVPGRQDWLPEEPHGMVAFAGLCPVHGASIIHIEADFTVGPGGPGSRTE